MLLEPRAQQRAVAPINDFITTSYSCASNMTALRLFLENEANDAYSEHVVLRLADTAQQLVRAVDAPHSAPDQLASHALEDRPAPQLMAQLAEPHAALTRRLDIIAEQARRLSLLARTIDTSAEDSARHLTAALDAPGTA